VTYVEHRGRNQVHLVDAQAYRSASSPEEKRAALLYSGPAPKPDTHEVSAALYTLAHAGVSPLQGGRVRRAYLEHVVAPGLTPPSEDDRAFYQRALSQHGQTLSPEQRALYRMRLKAT
jgi:hypothetical protein